MLQSIPENPWSRANSFSFPGSGMRLQQASWGESIGLPQIPLEIFIKGGVYENAWGVSMQDWARRKNLAGRPAILAGTARAGNSGLQPSSAKRSCQLEIRGVPSGTSVPGE
jgi:hypothetical protein